ncbi:MAG TPA: hypothetical protein VMT80_02190, partial [Candidatus Paceibacterota bacterium]|nr:hypothetical protein [Candidatus Paceibacterota bacterium]
RQAAGGSMSVAKELFCPYRTGTVSSRFESGTFDDLPWSATATDLQGGLVAVRADAADHRAGMDARDTARKHAAREAVFTQTLALAAQGLVALMVRNSPAWLDGGVT